MDLDEVGFGPERDRGLEPGRRLLRGTHGLTTQDRERQDPGTAHRFSAAVPWTVPDAILYPEFAWSSLRDVRDISRSDCLKRPRRVHDFARDERQHRLDLSDHLVRHSQVIVAEDARSAYLPSTKEPS